MDENRFNRWSRGLDELITRRNIGGLAAGLAALHLAGDADAKKKKKQKKKRKKKKPPACIPEAKSATCAGGKCGEARNNCNQQVDCGPCDRYEFEQQWGKVPGPGRLFAPRGIALDNAGNVYVTDSGNANIHKYSNDGDFISTWDGVALGLSAPRGIGVDSTGNVFIADYGNDRIVKLNSGGAFAGEWNTAADEEDELSEPTGIGIDPNNNVLVTDLGNHRVLRFSGSGGFLGEIGADHPFVSPTGVAADGAVVFVVDAFAHQLFRFPGTPIGSQGSGEGQFFDPHGVALDDDGNIYVSDTQNGRFQKFDSNGAFLTAVSDPGFQSPLGIAVDANGNVFILDLGGASVLKFHPAGSAARQGRERGRQARS